MKQFFGNVLSRRHRRKDNNNKPTNDTQSLQNVQGPQSPQENQVDQSPGTGTQLADEAQSSVHRNVGNQVLQITGTVLEKGLKTLKGFADFIPAPGLGPALEIVCGCIEVYHVSNLLMATSC